MFTIKNIDEQKQQEFKQQELLRKTAVAADAANRAKSAFLFNMSHDIVDLAELSDEVGTIIKVRTEAEGISFEVGTQELPVPYVYGSPTHLRKIFLNIYGNCIKYNKMNKNVLKQE